MALALEEFCRPLKRVRFFGQLVGSQAHNAREPQGIAAVMAIRFHDVVERHFQHYVRLYQAPEALVFDCVIKKPLRHLGYFGVSQS